MIRQGTFLEIDSQDTMGDSFDRHVAAIATAGAPGAPAGEREGAPSTVIVSKSGRRRVEEDDNDDGGLVPAVPSNRILLRRDMVCLLCFTYLCLSLAWVDEKGGMKADGFLGLYVCRFGRKRRLCDRDALTCGTTT